ncbi:hypothetical protein [Devosia sp. A449]
MKIDRRITNGLAWAGVLLVVGVPAADLLSAQFMGGPDRSAPPQIAVIEPEAPVPAPLEQRPDAEEAASVAPVVIQPAAQTGDAVDSFVQSGRPLPSYITGADAPVATAPVQPSAPAPKPAVATPAAPPVVNTDPVEVAALPPKIAPVPMPLSMRPRPVAPPLANAQPAVVIPPSVTAPSAITAADLEDWESGPLSEFLARRQQQGSAPVVQPDYDPNGFFLDQAPNQPRNRVIAREVDPPFFFGN